MGQEYASPTGMARSSRHASTRRAAGFAFSRMLLSNGRYDGSRPRCSLTSSRPGMRRSSDVALRRCGQTDDFETATVSGSYGDAIGTLPAAFKESYD